MTKMIKRFDDKELLLNTIIDKTLEEAKQLSGFNGYSIFVSKDEDTVFMRSDFNQSRINIEVVNGKVKNTSIG